MFRMNCGSDIISKKTVQLISSIRGLGLGLMVSRFFSTPALTWWCFLTSASMDPDKMKKKCMFTAVMLEIRIHVCRNMVQWNLVIKRSDITKPSYNKVILLVPALYISLFFYPDMRNLI